VPPRQPDATLPPGITRVLDEPLLGLYAGADFIAAPRGTAAPEAVRWYFQDEPTAVPAPGVTAAGDSPELDARADVRAWYAQADEQALAARPSLLWLAGSHLAGEVRLTADGSAIAGAGSAPVPFRIADRIPSNRSFYNADSARFFAGRSLRIRGGLEPLPDGPARFVGRALWPQEYRLPEAARPLPPAAHETPMDLVRGAPAGPSAAYSVRLLWERRPGAGARWADRPALGIVLNGAQGDDDDALGGHFAVATGRAGPGGEWSHWVTSNFYSLETFSEKGIIAAMVPMDSYLMDVNSGQSWYRPSYVLAVLLNRERVALALQSAVSRVFQHFYRQDLRYDNATANCAGITLDTLGALGWTAPALGPTSYARGLAAMLVTAARERSLALGRRSFRYFTAERTHLLPALAFEATAIHLMHLLGAAQPRRAPAGRFERWLSEDVEAIAFVHVPQLPSSRVCGGTPAASIDEYLSRTPRRRSQWKTIALAPRPLPPGLPRRR